MLTEQNRYLLERLVKQPGALDAELSALDEWSGKSLPTDYLDLLRYCNGAEGEMGEQFWFRLWSASDAIVANEQYQSKRFVPGCLLIGSDGAATLFGIGLRSCKAGSARYCQFAAEALSWVDIEFSCDSLAEFLEHLTIP
jgi:hypothetical protein